MQSLTSPYFFSDGYNQWAERWFGFTDDFCIKLLEMVRHSFYVLCSMFWCIGLQSQDHAVRTHLAWKFNFYVIHFFHSLGTWEFPKLKLSCGLWSPGKEADFGASTITHFPAFGILLLTDPSRTLVRPAAVSAVSLHVSHVGINILFFWILGSLKQLCICKAVTVLWCDVCIVLMKNIQSGCAYQHWWLCMYQRSR